jgi:tetratricopeptide (TPR) repeat protein
VRQAVAPALCMTVLAIAAVGCGSWTRSRVELLPVAIPEVGALHPAVQKQIRDAHESLASAQRRDAGDAEVAAAFGHLGMLLQAAEFFDAAEPAYLNAQRLVPNDTRWPYYLGHLHKSRGNMNAAEAAFTRVLDQQPTDLATLVWLGRLQLDAGRPDAAEQTFVRAEAVAPSSVAVLAGLGRASLARRDFAGAIRRLEEALRLDPSAESLHAPLAAAYQSSGASEKAQPHLRQWQNRDILVPDPLNQELDMLLESGLAYELRGVRALEARDFASAAEYFRRGLALTPENTALRRSLGHKLGTALYAAGQEDAALAQFEEVARSAPTDAIDESGGKAFYSLGVILMSRADAPGAIEHFRTAILRQPTNIEAHLALGEALRRTRQVRASLVPYEEALKLNPQAAQARWGYALALVRLGQHREAVSWLTSAMALHPDRPEFAHLLARVLASAPDPAVRDGQRAMQLVKSLLSGQKTTELGETMAMALAEVGEYGEAAAVQRGVLDAVRRGGIADDMRRIETNLRMYERHQPVRTVWIGERPDQGPVTLAP